MTPEEVREAVAAGAVVLDMRPPKPFCEEHVEGAVNIQFNRADLAERALLSLPQENRYIVHAKPDPIAKVAVQLLREAEFEVLGHLEGGLDAWKEAGLPTSTLPVIDVDQLKADLDRYRVIDTREGFEYRFGRVPGSELMEWTEPWSVYEGVPDDRPLALVCGDQVRSSYVASIMHRAGKNAALVFGGMVDWLEREYPVEKTPRKGKD